MEDAVLRGFAALGMLVFGLGLGALALLCIVVGCDAWNARQDRAAGKRITCTCCVGSDETVALPCPVHD